MALLKAKHINPAHLQVEALVHPHLLRDLAVMVSIPTQPFQRDCHLEIYPISGASGSRPQLRSKEGWTCTFLIFRISSPSYIDQLWM
jgi:hypothetical protein